MRRLLVLLLAVPVLLVGAAPVPAAPSPVLALADPKGDAIDGRPSMDILSVTYDVKTLKKGNPPSLLVTMKLAAPYEQQLAAYHVKSQIPGCGFFDASFAPGTLLSQATGSSSMSWFIECGPGDEAVLLFVKPTLNKDTITFGLSLDSMPKKARAGAKLTAIRAFTTMAEPVMGILGNGELDFDAVEGVPTDEVRTPKEYSFA